MIDANWILINIKKQRFLDENAAFFTMVRLLLMECFINGQYTTRITNKKEPLGSSIKQYIKFVGVYTHL